LRAGGLRTRPTTRGVPRGTSPGAGRLGARAEERHRRAADPSPWVAQGSAGHAVLGPRSSRFDGSRSVRQRGSVQIRARGSVAARLHRVGCRRSVFEYGKVGE
jgi:hypothetical protein